MVAAGGGHTTRCSREANTAVTGRNVRSYAHVVVLIRWRQDVRLRARALQASAGHMFDRHRPQALRGRRRFRLPPPTAVTCSPVLAMAHSCYFGLWSSVHVAVCVAGRRQPSRLCVVILDKLACIIVGFPWWRDVFCCD
jgi:hypothetical protein